MSETRVSEMRPRPETRGKCLRCLATWRTYELELPHEDAWNVVSPQGTEHFGKNDGDTECGIDATGERWWWAC